MKKGQMLTWILGIVGILMLIGLLYYANYDRPRYTITESSGIEYETARVLEVIEDNTVMDETTENVLRGSMKIKLELLTGRYQGQVVTTTNYFGAVNNVIVGAGDKVTVRIDTIDKGKFEVNVYNYHRTGIILGIIGLFVAVLIVIGGKQGLKTVIGLVFTILCIVFILVPLCLKGYPPIAITCLVVFITNLVCFALIGGVQTKTVTASIGTMCGVLTAAIFAYVAEKLTGITTFQMDEAEALLLLKSSYPIQMRGLFISGILIAAMGAVMDIAMTISSALDELHKHNPDLPGKELFRSGMNIGKDAMGTMSDTLIIAFAGGSLNMMILIYSYGVSFIQLVNTDFVSFEVIRAVAGSMGIILTVPIVSAISAGFYETQRKRKKQQKGRKK